MRAIKFRAWNKDWGMMCRVDRLTLDENGDVFSVDFKIETTDGGEHDEVWEDYGDNVAIMQYTGLKDKNGVEIYEGDIVTARPEWTDEYMPFEVKFGYRNKMLLNPDDGEGEAVLSGFYLEKLKELGGTFLSTGKRLYGSKVIGNIYENKELL